MEWAHQKIWRHTLKKIAHRGNTNGPSANENMPWYIQQALNNGFDVEIDIWRIGDRLWLGHDSAQYLVSEEFLYKNAFNLWIHCKNFEAMDYFAKQALTYNFFWHQTDDFTITNHGQIWTYPGREVGDSSVIVDLEGTGKYNCYGICSDYVALI